MMDIKLKEAIKSALCLLGTGECSIMKEQCPGCYFETKEAIAILRDAIEDNDNEI